MIPKPKSNREAEEMDDKIGLCYPRQRHVATSPGTRFSASALHNLDPIRGWLQIGGTPEIASPAHGK